MLRFVKRTTPETYEKIEGLPGWLSELLAVRGVDSVEKAKRFLHPDVSQLHDPFLMEGMEEAVFLLQEAIRQEYSIAVYGDYDVDGVSAASMLVLALRRFGARADYYIPSRHGEGYGLNGQAVSKLAKDYRLLLTVDCGITSVREVALAKELGMGVIVTDHHQLGEEIPSADAVLNPLMGEYPFRRLCGTGVALKLVHALFGLDAAMEYLDLAALATIADLVPLTDENRVIASLGLEKLKNTQRPGLKALMKAAGIAAIDQKGVKAGQVAFGLAPRLNAGGRLASASIGVELILTEDEDKAQELAEKLDHENAQRQKLEAEIVHEALRQVEDTTDFLNDRVLIAVGEGWNSGVIGLAASRLTERFHYPSIVLAQSGDECVGSARSIPGINIHQMLSACGDLFLRFGGHEQAAGLTIAEKNLAEFKRRLNDVIREKCDPEVYIPVREYDLQLSLRDVTEEMAQSLLMMQPTGFGNPEPVFLVKDAQVQDMRPVGRDGAHLKCALFEEGAVRSAIAFQMGPMQKSMPDLTDVLFSPELNEWNGSITVQCNIKAIRQASHARLPGSEELSLRAALQEIRRMTANTSKIHPAAAQADESVLEMALSGVQGTVILAHAPKTAMRIAMTYGDQLQFTDHVQDKRGFHTLLYPASLTELTDIWQTVVMADGEILPGEASMIRERCPRAKVLILPRNKGLAEFLKPLKLTVAQMRGLYTAVKQNPGASLARLSEAAGLSGAQTRAGLHIFMELELLLWEEEPYRLTILPVKKRSPEESMLYQALQKAADF